MTAPPGARQRIGARAADGGVLAELREVRQPEHREAPRRAGLARVHERDGQQPCLRLADPDGGGAAQGAMRRLRNERRVPRPLDVREREEEREGRKHTSSSLHYFNIRKVLNIFRSSTVLKPPKFKSPL